MPMPDTPLSSDLLIMVRNLQREEVTEYNIYLALSSVVIDPYNHNILSQLAQEEREHAEIWQHYTGETIPPDVFKFWFYYLLSRIFGLTFGIKLMERAGAEATKMYGVLAVTLPEAERIRAREQHHEEQIIALIDEQKLRYIGSVVLGFNDALVEFTGTLAGLTFALQDSRLIAVVGLIMGVAASLSMAAAEYLSRKSEGTRNNPFTASLYTGIAYFLTVIALIAPFLIFQSPFLALPVTLVGAVIIIVLFTWYISVAQDLNFRKRFTEMAGLSLGIAAVSFLIGVAIRIFLGVTV
jgi:VIT1/CCC1 family predicted Fe2+/Mn2+ transporter